MSYPANGILSGWLYKACRFSLLHSLKERYFILVDSELRYYKHPDDQHPAGTIDLRNATSVEEHNTTYHHTNMFGFRIIAAHNKNDSKSSHHTTTTSILFTESERARQEWMDKIQFVIDRLFACKQFCSSRYCSNAYAKENELLLIHSKNNDSVLDKWLDKLNLTSDDEIDKCCKNCCVSPVISESSQSSSSNSSNSIVGLENRSLESLLQVGYFYEERQGNEEPQPLQQLYYTHELSKNKRQALPNKLNDTTVKTRPIKSLLKQREVYANIASNDNELFDSKLVIPLSPRPFAK